MTDFSALIGALTRSGVEFIIIGGAAATAHGASRLTMDLDVVYRRTPENIDRLVAALAPFAPYLRGAPPGLPFHFDARTIRNGLNFTFRTTAGDIDLLGEITGGGAYEDLTEHTVEMLVFGVTARCLDLGKLIEVKRALGRPKDLEAIAELEELFEERSA